MKICFFETRPDEEAFFASKLEGNDLQFSEETLTEETASVPFDAQIISVFIYSKLSAKVLRHFPELRLIATRSTGFDHIDVEYCLANNITVCNLPNYGENTVAEHAFALILALSRKIVESVEKTRRGEFETDGLTGFDLFSKTIGVLGTGRIGSRIAQMAKGFGMKVLAFDKKKNEELEATGVEYVSVDRLLKNSDIISVNLRHTAETHHFLDEEKFSRVKKRAYLINTARGGLVDTHALLAALDNGTLAGAGLDVLEEECSIKEDMGLISKQFPKKCLMINIANNILARKPNVIITPHNAFNSVEAFRRIQEITAENIIAYQQSRPINKVR